MVTERDDSKEETAKGDDKYDVVLEKVEKKTGIKDFSIYLGAGYSVHIKTFKKSNYINFLRENEHGDPKNRFNLPLNLLDNLNVAIQYMKNHAEA